MVERLANYLTDWRVLVNCAAIFEPDDVKGLEMDNFRRTLRVNAGSPARMAQEFFARARAHGGRRVIQVTDQKLANPNPDFFSYTMSKHALASTIPMLAMGAATKNAKEVLGQLQLQGNRLRQASITKEILDIVGGAEALK